MTIHPILIEARALLAQNKRSEAAGLLDCALRSRPVALSADEGLAMARLAEEAGALDVALECYHAVLDASPDHREGLLRLARLQQDRGAPDRALAPLRRLAELEPADEANATALIEGLAEAGQTAEARARLGRLRDTDASGAALDRLQAWLGGEDSPQGSDGWPDIGDHAAPADHAALADYAAPPNHSGPTASSVPDHEVHPDWLDADAITFWSCFAGREGIYARQWAAPDGRRGYTPVHEPFTADVARQHLLGAVTVGVYPVRLDQTTPILAFDLDVASFALAQSRGDVRARAAWLAQAHRAAFALVDACAGLGIPALVEDSGHKGRHVWVLFSEPLPTAGVRRLGDHLRAQVGALGAAITLETFPKQSRVPPGKVGNLIKLPLGVHRVTGRPCPLLDRDGRPLANPVQALARSRKVGRDGLVARLERAGLSPRVEGLGEPSDSASAPTAALERGPRASPPRRLAIPSQPALPGYPDPPAGAEVAPGLRPAPGAERYHPDRDLDLQWLLDRCPVLARIAGRAAVQRQLDREELLVLTYTLGHLPHGEQAVNHFVDLALNLDSSARLKSRLRGNPMSCPKIRSKVGRVTRAVRCDCRFHPASGHYPTPLLHLESLERHGLGSPSPTALSALQVERSVSELLRVRAEVTRLSALALRLERSLRQIFERQAIDELPTPAGVLRLAPGREGRLVLDLPGETCLPPGEPGLQGVAPTIVGVAEREVGPPPAGDHAADPRRPPES